MQSFNQTIGQDIQRIFKTKGENIVAIADIVQPTKEIQTRINILKRVSYTTSGTSSVYTTPTDKDFYLCFAEISFLSDVLNDTLLVQLSVILDGESLVLAELRKVSLAIAANQLYIVFNQPLKLDKGTAINILGTYTAGALTKSAIIGGYTTD